MVRIRDFQGEAKAPIEQYTGPVDWYKPTLQRLIEERRAIPKGERMAQKKDAIDEVDTTDLENWSYRGKFFMRDYRTLEEEAEQALKENDNFYQSPYHGQIKDQGYNPLERPDLTQAESLFDPAASSEMASELDGTQTTGTAKKGKDRRKTRGKKAADEGE